MRRIIHLCSCLLLTLSSFAQSVQFTFVYQDIESSAAAGVSGVTVEVENINTQKVLKAVTNQKGEAVFNLPSGPTYDVNIPLDDFSFEFKTDRYRKYSQAMAKVSHKGYSPTYYKEMTIQDSLDNLAWEKEQAEWERQAAIDAKKPGTMLFYCINPEGIYTNGVEVYDGDENGELIGSVKFYWRGETCTGSVENAQNKIAITKDPGTYTYYAKTGDGVHEWRGEYTIKGNSTKKIPLFLDKAKKIRANASK
ncbi:MAG: carboxypeptidase regulatory-like domain-containing protein [Aureispira sp.]|nr:carboxypeptidase regulatory-like domain-containing protein [Aureispira sp.]